MKTYDPVTSVMFCCKTTHVLYNMCIYIYMYMKGNYSNIFAVNFDPHSNRLKTEPLLLCSHYFVCHIKS